MGLFDKLFQASRDPQRVRRPRAAPRVPIGDRAQLRRPTEPYSLVVTLADLSTRGAKVATSYQMPINDDVTLTIQSGIQRTIDIDCKVLYRRYRTGRLQIDYGLNFIAMHPGDVEKLQIFLAERDDARKKVAVPYSRKGPSD